MDEKDYITRKEHEEFARRMEAEGSRRDDENKRQNRRISDLEEKVEEIHSLALLMERMSGNIEKMTEAINRQGNLIEKQIVRIDEIEKEPAKDSKQIKMAIITSVIGAVVGSIGGVVGALIALL